MTTSERILLTRTTRNSEQLRERVETQLDLSRIYKAIDADPELVGAGVVYIDSRFNIVELRQFRPLCRLTPVKVVIREAPESYSPQEFASNLEVNTRDANVVGEALGAALACTGAVLSWLVVTSGLLTAPFTGGMSMAVTAIGYSAAAASSFQCFNTAIVRTGLEAYGPDILDDLDSQAWYRNTAMALDIVTLAGASTSMLTTVRMVKMAKASSSRSMIDILRGLNRPERTRLTKELLRVQHPGVSNAMMKALQRSGKSPKRLTSSQVRRATITQIRDALSGSFAILGSTASGTVRSIAIGIYEEIE